MPKLIWRVADAKTRLSFGFVRVSSSGTQTTQLPRRQAQTRSPGFRSPPVGGRPQSRSRSSVSRSPTHGLTLTGSRQSSPDSASSPTTPPGHHRPRRFAPRSTAGPLQSRSRSPSTPLGSALHRRSPAPGHPHGLSSPASASSPTTAPRRFAPRLRRSVPPILPLGSGAPHSTYCRHHHHLPLPRCRPAVRPSPRAGAER
jgi:hypothetical protein